MKNKRRYGILGILGILVLSGCGSTMQSKETVRMTEMDAEQVETTEGGVKQLTAEGAYQRMQSGDPVVVVDVRTKEEYDEGHVEGAILIPNEEIADTKPEQLPVEDAEILVYCRSGNRSAQAAEKLSDLGYTNVSDFGGIIDWTYTTSDTPWEEKEGTLSSFRSTSLEGKAVDETLFANGKLTMVNVWATYCGPCLSEMPDLGELQAEYKDKRVQIVGVVIDALDSSGNISQSQVEKARELVIQTGADYEHVLPSNDLIASGLDSIYSVPTTFFVDSEGNQVGETYTGSRSKEEWSAIIESILVSMRIVDPSCC